MPDLLMPEPIDPYTVTAEELRTRAAAILYGLYEPCFDLGPDRFQCWLCRRCFTRGWSDGEVVMEELERFGKLDADSELVCDDCDRIIAHANGHPEGTYRD